MKTQEQKTFQRDLLISLALHLIFVVIFIYGTPSLLTKVPEEDNTITFEILTVADIANVRNQDTKKPEVKEIKESQKIEKSAAKPKEEVKKPEEKPLEKTTEPEKEAEIIPEKKTPNKSTSSQENEGKFARGTHNEDSPLTQTDFMHIQNTIEWNWNKPAGFEGVVVRITPKIDIDGNIEIDSIEFKGNSINKQSQNLLRDSAKRAVRKASPIKGLSPENYDIWKNIPLNFPMH